MKIINNAHYKKAIKDILIIMVAINFIVVLGSLLLLKNYSGDVVLSGTIGPGEILEGKSMLTEGKDVTFIFTSGGASEFHIGILDPDGFEYFWTKRFRILDRRRDTTDYTFTFTPKSTGTYYFKITDASYRTDVKLVSGMINPTKNGFVFVIAGAFWFISIIFTQKNEKTPLFKNKKKSTILIGLILGLVTGFIMIYFSSM